MKNCNPLTLTGIALNGLIVFITAAQERYQILVLPSIIALLLCIIGAILVGNSKLKVGSILFYVGSILFIPLGIVGIMGIRKTINSQKTNQFIQKNYPNDTH